MKIKELETKLNNLANENGLIIKKEYTTKDGTRIDYAVLNNEEKIIAIELEKTYSWMDRRVLYNAVKAHREGFKDLVIIYDFNDTLIKNSWINHFIKEIGINMTVIKSKNIHELFKKKQEIQPPKIEQIR